MTKTSIVDFGIRRFGVLHHTGIEHAHFDFMFDTAEDSQLVTFRVEQWPLLKSQFAAKLRDHRRAYLNFQGTIPGDRGQVDRIDEGSVHVFQTPSGWLLRRPDGKFWMLLEPEEKGPADGGNWWITLSEQAWDGVEK